MAKANESATQSQDGKNLRNFRHNSDIENFYRFIKENDLRREAKMILEAISKKSSADKKKKKRKKSKARKTLQ